MRRVWKTGVWKSINLKVLLFCLGVFLAIGANHKDASAGWRMDGNRFLQSLHADTSCLECHTEIEEMRQHPNPANATRKDESRFDPEMCLACHDDVQSQIEDDASHGGEDVNDTEQFLNCVDCHDPHYEGAPEEVTDAAGAEFSEEDQACMDCHQQVREDDPLRVEKNRSFCFSCHSTGKSMPPMVPVMEPEQYAKSPHAAMDCLTCHPQADGYGHDRQVAIDCRECHTPHEESVAHEAHTNVSCQACHLEHVVPMRDTESNDVIWQRASLPGTVTGLHNLSKPDGQGCARCHFEDNSVGAAAMILPPKSILCMPCHPATFSAGDTTTLISLAVFGIGFLGFISLWFSGSLAGTGSAGVAGNLLNAVQRSTATIFSAKFGAIAGTIWYDVLLQRRLYRRSAQRWAIHALIFWPFVVRFVWGMVALFASNWLKDWPLAWALINKNHPITAFLFDFTGICLGVGILLAFVRGSQAEKSRVPGLPSQDHLALLLIGGIVVVGFVLEGMRIALTGADGPAAYAFLGFGISQLFTGMKGIGELYGYIWYLHAILTGAFVAYLPFSRMMHIIMSPVVLAVNAATEKDHH